MSCKTQEQCPRIDSIKQEPEEWCEDYLPNTVVVKEEPEDTSDDLTGFDPHAWALNHLKIETKEPLEEHENTSCSFHDSGSIVLPVSSIANTCTQNARITSLVSASYTFPQGNNVWTHVEKVFYCEVCNKHFSTKGNLGNHMRSHTQEKPFKCNTCGRCFSFNCNLKTHHLTHTGVKPFQCTMCGKCFSTKGNMSVHLRIHTGERPFKCTICARSFTVKDNLQRHMKIHTPL